MMPPPCGGLLTAAGRRPTMREGCRLHQPRKRSSMPLFEVETTSHIIITWAEGEDAATEVVRESYPNEPPLRVTRRPRDTWVISKSALGITKRDGPLLDRPRLPGQGRRRQAARHPPLHAAHRRRSGTLPQGNRVEHGDGLVTGRRVHFFDVSGTLRVPVRAPRLHVGIGGTIYDVVRRLAEADTSWQRHRQTQRNKPPLHAGRQRPRTPLIVLVGLISLIGLAMLFTFPARLTRRRDTGHGLARQPSPNRIRAMLMYEAQHHCFPAVGATEKDGQPLQSWRVAILPYLGQRPSMSNTIPKSRGIVARIRQSPRRCRLSHSRATLRQRRRDQLCDDYGQGDSRRPQRREKGTGFHHLARRARRNTSCGGGPRLKSPLDGASRPSRSTRS